MFETVWPFGSGRDDHDEPSSASEDAPAGVQALSVSASEMFEALANARRRRAIRAVADADGPVEIGALAEDVASEEYGRPVPQLDRQERKRVYVSLYQTHLPKLADLGIVALDNDQIVRETAATDAALKVMATALVVTGGDK